jgi:hypothetical protein
LDREKSYSKRSRDEKEELNITKWGAVYIVIGGMLAQIIIDIVNILMA